MHGHPRDIGASPLYVADVDPHAYLQVIPGEAFVDRGGGPKCSIG